MRKPGDKIPRPRRHHDQRSPRSPRAPGSTAGRRCACRRRPGRLIAGLPPLRIPALDLVTVGQREPRRTLVLEALVKLVPGRIARLGCRQRSGGETAVDQQSPLARSIVVGDDKPASRVHGGLYLEVAGPGHTPSGNLDVLAGEKAKVIAAIRRAARVVYVDQTPFDDYALRRINRSEEHTSELQSLAYLVCRLLLEKKKKPNNST